MRAHFCFEDERGEEAQSDEQYRYDVLGSLSAEVDHFFHALFSLVLINILFHQRVVTRR